MIIELPGGNKVLFGDEDHGRGLSEVSIGDNIRKATAEQLAAALASLASLVAVAEKSVGHMAHRPDKVEMEFGASLSNDCHLWIVSGEAKGEFKIKLTWESNK
jgi:hypothetical protein